jgi:ferrous iron transport protein A
VTMTLAQQPIGQVSRVHGVQTPPDRHSWARLLDDMGFAVGETVCVLRRGVLGGEPLVVRVGGSTYALRAAEAACVRTEVLP